jgi:hypothetical protein
MTSVLASTSARCTAKSLTRGWSASLPAPSFWRRRVRLFGLFSCLICLGLTGGLRLSATPTEVLLVNAVAAPAGLSVADLDLSQWYLGQGVFLCANVEEQVNDFAVWIHVYHDAEALYILARFTDKTPLNNHIPVSKNEPWNGDTLQFHLTSHPATDKERIAHVMAWQHEKGAQRVWVQYGADYQGGEVTNALTEGAKQGFLRYPDKTGYLQALRLPWKLLTSDGQPPAADDAWRFAIQAHFSDANHARTTVNDVVRRDIGGRENIYSQPDNWGVLHFPKAGTELKTPTTRMQGGREFPVSLKAGVPVIAWDGFVEQRPPPELGMLKPLDPARKEALRQLIRRLGSDKASERRLARRELQNILAEAMPMLQEFARDPDPEIRLSVRELMQGL